MLLEDALNYVRRYSGKLHYGYLVTVKRVFFVNFKYFGGSRHVFKPWQQKQYLHGNTFACKVTGLLRL